MIYNPHNGILVSLKKGRSNPQSWMLFSLIKEGNSDTYYKIYESWRRYAEWTKPIAIF